MIEPPLPAPRFWALTAAGALGFAALWSAVALAGLTSRDFLPAPWDVAAGMLLIKEAGGFVTDFRGGERCIERSEFLAANDGLHSRLHKLVASALRNV